MLLLLTLFFSEDLCLFYRVWMMVVRCRRTDCCCKVSHPTLSRKTGKTITMYLHHHSILEWFICEVCNFCGVHRIHLELLRLTYFLFYSHVGEEVACAILTALIPMGSQILSPTSEGIGFAELMVVMATLAGAGSGLGHAALFQAATGWLELWLVHWTLAFLKYLGYFDSRSICVDFMLHNHHI